MDRMICMEIEFPVLVLRPIWSSLKQSLAFDHSEAKTKGQVCKEVVLS